MKNLILLLLLFACGVVPCSAQTKISAIGRCDPNAATQQLAEVGDGADHLLAVIKNSCAYVKPMVMEGLRSKTYTFTTFSDSLGTKSTQIGYAVVEMDNGDKAFVRFQGISIMKNDQPESDEGTWSYTGGTGKLQGLTGKGTYKGAPGVDGYAEQIEGNYKIAVPKASAPKGKK